MIPTPTRRRTACALTSLLLALLIASPALAQPTTTTRADPLDPTAQVPATRHESSLAQFRRMGDDKPVPWREANDAVARIGGWRVYAREAQQPDPGTAEKKPAASPAPAPAAPASAAGPSGHKH